MEFFRHQTDAGRGRSMSKALDNFGHFGYAGWFLLLELYYEKLKTRESSYLRKCARTSGLWFGFPPRVLRQHLRTTPAKLRRFLEYCQGNGLLLYEYSPGTVELSICNLLELLDPKTRVIISKILENSPGSLDEMRGDKIRRDERRGEEKKVEKKPPKPKASPPPLHKLALLWNQHCSTLSKVKICNPSRIKKCEIRWKEWNHDFGQEDYWVGIIQRIAESTFCMGKNDRAWVATFDWLLQDDTHLKIDEGKYDNRKPLPNGKGPKTFQQQKSANNATLFNKYREQREKRERGEK